MRTLSPDSAPAPVSGRVSPVDGSGDAGTPPRPSRGRTATHTGPPAVDPPMPGQTELPLQPDQSNPLEPLMTDPKLIVEPEMEDTHYGIAVSHVGEDGDLIALGHHTPRKALAAFNRHARTFLGLANLASDRSALAADFEAAITPKRAVFRKPDPTNDWEDPDWSWVADWSDPKAANAVPVMLYRP